VLCCRNRDSVLGEGVCTVFCQHRSACQAQKIPFLVYSVVIDYAHETRKHNIQGPVYPDEYIDELVARGPWRGRNPDLPLYG